MQTWTIFTIELAIYVPLISWMIRSHRRQKREREARAQEWARLDSARAEMQAQLNADHAERETSRKEELERIEAARAAAWDLAWARIKTTTRKRRSARHKDRSWSHCDRGWVVAATDLTIHKLPGRCMILRSIHPIALHGTKERTTLHREVMDATGPQTGYGFK